MVSGMNERISALMDGELSQAEEASVLQSLRHNPDAADAWHSYHLIRDALRNAGPLDCNVRSQVAERLDQEPTVVAPFRRRVALLPQRKTWVALSAAASVAAVSTMGWMGWHQRQAVNEPAVVAQAASGTVDMRPYLAAHQQFAEQTNGRLAVNGAATQQVKFDGVERTGE